jgi:hypothetical protein
MARRHDDERPADPTFAYGRQFAGHLGRAQIGARRFVDHLLDDRLALGDLASLAVDRGLDRFVQHGD